jgi:hypothetical protein
MRGFLGGTGRKILKYRVKNLLCMCLDKGMFEKGEGK